MSRIVMLAYAALVAGGFSLWVSSAVLAPIAIGLACIVIALGIRHEHAVVIGIGLLAIVTAKISLLFNTNLSKIIGMNQ